MYTSYGDFRKGIWVKNKTKIRTNNRTRTGLAEKIVVVKNLCKTKSPAMAKQVVIEFCAWLKTEAVDEQVAE